MTKVFFISIVPATPSRPASVHRLFDILRKSVTLPKLPRAAQTLDNPAILPIANGMMDFWKIGYCKYCTNGSFGSCHPYGDTLLRQDWFFFQKSSIPSFQQSNP